MTGERNQLPREQTRDNNVTETEYQKQTLGDKETTKLNIILTVALNAQAF